ncbi:hypothetical protein LJK88_14235 [Paenibacillus sp. P26]|nr:hypothetical protein LJK88_14235 [Paenibacillus sp. P26]UUZ97910.1 hypothetical protein LJK87_23495 [Paenibacillus sp. P25]
MNPIQFPEGRELDFIGLGRLCIDLNSDQLYVPMEETVSFTKYVGDPRPILRLRSPSWEPGQDLSARWRTTSMAGSLPIICGS